MRLAFPCPKFGPRIYADRRRLLMEVESIRAHPRRSAGKKRQPPNLHAFDGLDSEQFEATGDRASGEIAE